jgi:peptide/nickel transport system substrate-binding protein/microcin C transport system substrate-binding protein
MKSVSRLGLLALVFFFSSSHSYAKSSYESFPIPKKGGTFNDELLMTPVTLNPILGTNMADSAVSSYFYMSLMTIDRQTYKDLPGLAEKVEVSKDKKEYTFTLNKNAKWSDGSPVTSEDIEYTFNKMMDPKVEAASLRSYFGGTTFKKVDALKFKFIVTVPKYNSLNVVTTFAPVQKKQFENEADFNKSKQNLKPIGNGPYKLKAISRDQLVSLEKDQNWWAKELPDYRPQFNHDLIQFKIMPDAALRYETLLKGGLDTLSLTSDQFTTQVKGSDKDKFGDRAGSGKNYWADRFPSDGPMSWFGLALNQKNQILSSIKVRQALAQLIDYQAMIDRAFFKTVEQSVSPFGSRTDNTSPELKSGAAKYKLDQKKAMALLKEDGWNDTDQNGLLDKVIDGKKVQFKVEVKLASAGPAGMKTVQIFKETFKKSGIELSIRAMDSSAFFKDFEDKNFEMALMGWGGGDIHPDPRQNWHSSSIANGGSNTVSYASAKVDQLIDKANLEFDHKKRAKLLQEINRELYKDLPYIFLVERGFVLQAISSKVKSPVWIQRYSTSIAKELFYF